MRTTTLLIQYQTAAVERRVGILNGDAFTAITGYATTLELAKAAIAQNKGLASLADAAAKGAAESYEAIAKDGRLLAPLDHPDAAHTYVTGTGLTHL
ncbi:MAG: FAH family protein, partial [Massilia sp.]|nr:FAH family protein [Massilia sp.]